MSTDLKIGISAGVLFVGLLGGLAVYKLQQGGLTLTDLGTVVAGAFEALLAPADDGGAVSQATAAPGAVITQVTPAAGASPAAPESARILRAAPAAGPASSNGVTEKPDVDPPPTHQPNNEIPTPQAESDKKDPPPAATPAKPGDTPDTRRPAPTPAAKALTIPPPPESASATADASTPALPKPSAPRPAVSTDSPTPARPALAPGNTAGAADKGHEMLLPPKPALTDKPRPSPLLPSKAAEATAARQETKVGPAAGVPAAPPKAANRLEPTKTARNAIGKVEEMLRLLQGTPAADASAVLQAQHAEKTDQERIVPAPPSLGQQPPRARNPKPSGTPKAALPADVPSVTTIEVMPGVVVGTEPVRPLRPAVETRRLPAPERPEDSVPTARPVRKGSPPEQAVSTPAVELSASASKQRPASLPAGSARTLPKAQPIPAPRSFTATPFGSDTAAAPLGSSGLQEKEDRKVIAKAAPEGPGTQTPERTVAASGPAPAADVPPRRIIPPAEVREELVAIGPTPSRAEKFQLVSRQELTDRDPAEQVKVASYDVESYIVLAGDTFESIAAAMYGRSEYGAALSHYNRHLVPPGERLTPGLRVKIPPARILEQTWPKLKSSAPAPAAGRTKAAPQATIAERPVESKRPAAPNGPLYTVRQEETLFAIAKKTLGNGERWREIYELNTDRLENEYTIPVGVVLRLPPQAKVESAPAAP